MLERTAVVASIAITGEMHPATLKAYANKIRDRIKNDRRIAQVRLLGFSDQDITIEIPAEALQRYIQAMGTEQSFDAVIMDLTIPGGMGGKEAVKQLLEIDPQARVIVSSGYATDPIMSEYKKYGFSAVITKPYSVGQLEETLHNLLKK